MKNLFKVFGIIAFAAIIGFSIAACGDTHNHEWGEWQSDATQHWKECSCGEEFGRANHTGNPCVQCGYNVNIPASFYGTYGYTSTGSLTITFRSNATFFGAGRSGGDVNGTYTVSGDNITLSDDYFGRNWTIISPTRVRDGTGDYWNKRP
jgi:uncharacterized lipoprotein YehR (DUF1307 family)